MAEGGRSPGHFLCLCKEFEQYRDRKGNKKPVLLMSRGTAQEIEIFQQVALQNPQLTFIRMLEPTDYEKGSKLFRRRDILVYVCPPGGKTDKDLNVERGRNFQDRLETTVRKILENLQ